MTGRGDPNKIPAILHSQKITMPKQHFTSQNQFQIQQSVHSQPPEILAAMQDLQKKTFQHPQTHNQQQQYPAPRFQQSQHSELQQFAFQRFIQNPNLRYPNSTSRMTAQTPLNNRHAFQGPRFPMSFPPTNNNPSSFTRPIMNCGTPQTNTFFCNSQPHHSMLMNSPTSNVFLMNTFANQPAPLLHEKNYDTKFINSSNIKGSNTNTGSNFNQSGDFNYRNLNVSSNLNCNFSNLEMFEIHVPRSNETDMNLGKSEHINLKMNDFSGNRLKPGSTSSHPRQQGTYMSKFVDGASERYSDANKYETQKKNTFAPRNDVSTTNKKRDFEGKINELMLNDNSKVDNTTGSKSTFFSEQHSARPKVNPKTPQRENSTYTRDHDSIRKRDSFMSVSQDRRNRTSRTLDKSSYSKREYRSSSHREMHAHSRSRLRSSTSPINSHSSHKREKSFEHKNVPVSLEFSLGSVSSQLSQYRQDLLKSEKNNKDDSALPLKRPKLDVSDHYSDEELGTSDNINYFTRSCPADLYFIRNSETGNMEATPRMIELENKFESEIVKRSLKFVSTQDEIEEPSHQPPTHHHHHHCTGTKSSCDSSSSSSSDEDDEDDGAISQIMEEWDKRKKHPYSLHPELWYNLKGQANDGPLCRCSIKSRQSGIRHDIYPGEKAINLCKDESNNLRDLYHYRITMSPYTNFLTKVPTLINHDNHEYIFEGFSMFSHSKLENIPPCKLLRFNIEYTIHFIPESAPENFTVRSINLFNTFIFSEILELVDLDWTGQEGGCNRFHFMPRFCRTLPDSGCKEVLSMNTVLSFLIKSASPLVDESRLQEIMDCGESEWHNMVDNLRGMIVTNPGMKPSSVRIDQLDRKVTTPQIKLDSFIESDDEEKGNKPDKTTTQEEDIQNDLPKYPLIIHQGYRPAQLSYAGDPVYRKAWKQYVKFRHLLNSKPKILPADKLKLKEQEEKLREIRMKKTMKREVTIELSSKGFLCTGLRADLCQHALMVPVLMSHLRFHICLDILEDKIEYKFADRNLLQLSLTHTSYRTNYGTNPDHTRNSLTNCGMRQVEYGDRRIHYQNTRKRGICILVDIMSRLGKQEETASEIPHNERLEFLGDAVIEFLTSVHLFYMFPWLEEGGLTTYRMALVQNQHLAVLAKKLKLQDYMLYVHGPDLCHESDLRHAMANCCEALMGALFLDGGIDVVDKIFSRALFDDDQILLHTWNDLPKHVLQQQEPGGDRRWVKSSPILQKLEKFEESIGIRFNHIRLLAKAFTHRNIGTNPLTMGHNQRLEFLGDTVLQLIASEYLYKHYPEHHEGHLSLLRSSLVNSRTQGLVYDDLGMSEYVIFNENAISDGLDMKTKQRADILESFVGALFVDKDLDYCRTFCNVCFFPRLKDFILNQDWNDPKSQLQQCCLTLREVGGGEPDIPVYKVIESIGPTNTRKYVVAVYFRGKRLARGTGHSIQQAEMAAATQALKKRAELFPILQHQRRFLERMKNGERIKEDDDPEAGKKLRRVKLSRRKSSGKRHC